MGESNYALYRSQLKDLISTLDEKDIYSKWHELTFGGWNVQNSPMRGYDGKYHYIYISVRDDGKIYVGKHSTDRLDDGYQGSGIDISKSIEQGHTFKTTILEYFRNSNAAYDAEQTVVNNRFLNESSDVVLNKGIGGKDYSPATINAYEAKTSSLKSNNQSSKSCSEPKVVSTATKPRPRYYTFSMLGLKVCDELTFVDDDNITCMVKDDCNVTYNGRTYTLFSLAKQVSDVRFRNSLDVWKFKGKTLSSIRDAKFN